MTFGGRAGTLYKKLLRLPEENQFLVLQVQACNNANVTLLTNSWSDKINSKENLVSKPNKGMQSCEMLQEPKSCTMLPSIFPSFDYQISVSLAKKFSRNVGL